jgi:hypothetical protein
MTFRIFPPSLVPCAILLAAGLGVRGAEPVTADLGQNLSYLRVAELPTGSPALGRPSLVLDLRFTTADATAAALLADQLRGRAPKPTFVLVNAATAPAILAVLPQSPGLVTLGLPATGFAPDVVVNTTAADDRRAYAAPAAGTPIGQLIDDTLPDKPRDDEAALARLHTGGADESAAEAPAPDDSGENRTPPAPPEDSPPSTREPRPASKPAPPRLLDLVLLRAVQLHRTLVAFGRIPAG